MFWLLLDLFVISDSDSDFFDEYLLDFVLDMINNDLNDLLLVVDK